MMSTHRDVHFALSSLGARLIGGDAVAVKPAGNCPNAIGVSNPMLRGFTRHSP